MATAGTHDRGALRGGSPRRGRVVMALQFFPRGGSSHVARNLARWLPRSGWEVGLLSGSLSRPGRPGDASQFYDGCEVHTVDMTEALASEDPMLADPPLHPSYEDRPGAPDRVMADLDADAFEHHARVWTDALRAAGARDADVLHLHHLTSINEAARRAAPGVPIVGHLHGTELLMLESIERDPGRWRHGREWAARMREWARACSKLVVLSGTQVARAGALLGIAPEDCVRVPNGFDPGEFAVREVDRLGHWRRHLVQAPRGWRPAGEPGSITYDEASLEAFAGEATVLLYVGRFTEVKRLDVLLEAYARALPRLRRRAPLVLCGGFPGEWEGEHPWEAVQRLGLPDVFLAGWHEHDELPSFMAASDAIVLPSVREQFGQVLVEGMACGLPAIAVDAYGPTEIVEPGITGWLVPAADAARLADALVEAVNDPAERRRRGRLARADAEARFAWPSLAGRVASIYDEVAASRRP